MPESTTDPKSIREELTVDPEVLRQRIRDIPDFPQPGILFRDIMPLLADANLFHDLIDAVAHYYQDKVDVIVAIESRGFIFGAPLAYALGAGIVPVRKAGKLPGDTVVEHYDLEYGTAALEIQTDAVQPGQRVLLVDDLLATGGTARAAASLVERLGGTIQGIFVLAELSALDGRDRLSGYDVQSVVIY